MEEHLRTCATCRAYAARMDLAHAALGMLDRRRPVPRPLLDQIEAESLRHAPQQRLNWKRAGGLLAAMAAIVLSLGVLWPHMNLGKRQLPDLSTILVEDHLRYLPSDDAPDVRSSDGPTVKQWFATRLDFPVTVPALANAKLEGGRLCFIDGKRVALLFYRRGATRISVFVLPNAPLGGMHLGPSATWRVGMHGFNVIAVRAANVTYAMVSDLSHNEMLSMLNSPHRTHPWSDGEERKRL